MDQYHGTEFQDKTIVCSDCGRDFTWTANDQAFYAEKQYSNPPKRCKPCRVKRKSEGNSGGGRGEY